MLSGPTFRAFWSGFRALMPLWLGVIPFGLAYAVTARSAGLTIGETQLMSLAVFAGSSQFSAASLVSLGASGAVIVLATFLINLRHLLYGLSLGRQVQLTWPQKLIAAFFLTDEAYGVTVTVRAATFPFLLGAELSLFTVWNACTFIGALLGAGIPDPASLGVDFIFPLAFLALLIPLLQTRVDAFTALFAGVVALVAARFVSSGLEILIASVLGSLLGAWLTGGEPAARKSMETQPEGERR